MLDDGWCGHDTHALLDDPPTEIRELFSAGRDVAFAVDQSGRYRGGLPGTEGLEGCTVSHSAIGLVRDRVGLRRAVRA